MFTGIVEERGTVRAIALSPDGATATATLHGPTVTTDAQLGDSIAVSGVCLTVTSFDADSFTVDLMAETLERTTAKSWAVGSAVNLERSVTPQTRMGGHIVQGHVDGVGTVVARTPHDAYDELRIAVGVDLARFIAGKGAIAVDGISLTVIDVFDTPTGAEFTLGIIPTTRDVTTIGAATVGAAVNIEVDVMAKYAERLITVLAS